MFGSSTLEVATGVIFIFLSLSLVCTAANELIASVTSWRAKNLAHGIRNLLNYKDNSELLDGFYSLPLIQSLYRDSKTLPSYIPSRTFALALMDLIAPSGSSGRDTFDGIRQAIIKAGTDGVVDKQVGYALLVLVDDAENSIRGAVNTGETALGKVAENVQTWFNDSMERVSGWYKRKTQALTFALALVFTVALNVDTIMITQRLSSDSALRASLTAMAEKTAAQQPPTVTHDGKTQPLEVAFKDFAEKSNALEGLGIPLGWTDKRNWPGGAWSWAWVIKIFGLLLTAGAASLGAPFWFDMLNKIVTIRSSGKAPEEKQKSPKEVPTPTEVGQTPKEARESRDAMIDVKDKLDELMKAIAAQNKPPGTV
ncbi:MAG TPA: hypothetical protein VNS63_06720 [Blastocatellia bacterium]|nr:hypothetical protein [Blastocatellia bacterium]